MQSNKNKYNVIGLYGKMPGLMAIVHSVLPLIDLAISRGAIPIVDLQHYKNLYFKDNMEYKENTWEYYFEQPCNYHLENIKEDDEIEILNNKTNEDELNFAVGLSSVPLDYKDKERFKEAEKIKKIYKKYIRLNEEILNYVQTKYNKIIGTESEVLGIMCRGTDYTSLKPLAHSRQPDPLTIIKKAKELKKRFNYKKIFLATEDINIYNLFKKEFGEELLSNDQYRYDSDTQNKQLGFLKIENVKNFQYNLGKEYLASIYILSKLKYFIAGRTSGSVATYFLSDQYKYFYIWDIGNYGDENFQKKSFIKSFFSIKKELFKQKKRITITILGIKIKISKRY